MSEYIKNINSPFLKKDQDDSFTKKFLNKMNEKFQYHKAQKNALEELQD